MGRHKADVSDESEADVSRHTSAKKSTSKGQADNAGREMRRLRKGNQAKESKQETARQREDEEVEAGYGRFQYMDDEGPTGGKHSRGKSGPQQQDITKFASRSGKTSRKEKQEQAEDAAARRAEKRNKRKQKDEESDFDLMNVKLDDDDEDDLVVEDDDDDELYRQINNKTNKKQAAPPATVTHNSGTRPSRSNGRAAEKMDIEEIEVVRGKKENVIRESKAASTSAAKEKSKNTVSREATPVKTSKKAAAKDKDDDGDHGLVKGPLSGMTIVFTGLFNCTGGDNKEELIEVIQILGAKNTSAVSGKTSLLVAGHILPDGREVHTSKKYRDAKEKKVKIMTEEEFEALLKQKTGMTLTELINGGAKEFALKDFDANVDIGKSKPTVGNKMDIEEPLPATQGNLKSIKMVDERIDDEIGDTVNETALWTEKYAPKRVSDIIGNKGVIDKLKNWILSWDDVVIRGNKKETKWKGGFMGGGANMENPNARAALLSGSPGIGKTSTVRLLCKELGYNLIEQNASDMRNKNAVAGTFSSLGDSMTLTFSGKVAKTIILMDEVDGMSSDRGGTAALNDFIKKTKVPVICICNDRSHPKMRTLAGNCYDLKFIKPTKAMVVDRIAKILKQEGMTADQNSLEKLVEQMNGDIRQILGFLQMWKKRKDNKFIFAAFSKEVEKFSKDDAVTLSNFDAATILLNKAQRGNKSYKDLLGLFFIDYDLVPLLVQENYLNSANKATDLNQLKRIAKAADSIARSDQTNLLVRRDQNWKLLDAVGFTSSVLPCYLVAEFCPFAKFPEFYGKFSSEKKMQREIKELKMAMMEHITGSSDAIKFDYAPGIFNLLKAKMARGSEDALEEAIEIYENYGLTPELVKEHLVDVIYNPDKKDLMEGVETKTKANFTRLYNSKFKESLVQKKKKRPVVDEGSQVFTRIGRFRRGDGQ